MKNARPWHEVMRAYGSASMRAGARLSVARSKGSHAQASAAIEGLLLEMQQTVSALDPHVASAVARRLAEYVGTIKVPAGLAGRIRFETERGDASWDWARPQPRRALLVKTLDKIEVKSFAAYLAVAGDAHLAYQLGLGLICRLGTTPRDHTTVQVVLERVTAELQAWRDAKPKDSEPSRELLCQLFEQAISAFCTPADGLRLDPKPLHS